MLMHGFVHGVLCVLPLASRVAPFQVCKELIGHMMMADEHEKSEQNMEL